VAPTGVLSTISDRILSLHGWVALAIVFLAPALEASAFVGFVFPGEIAVLLGGVLAYQHRIPLWGAIVAAVTGAVIGDSIGYFIGRRWGRSLLHGTVGRLPLIRNHIDRHLDNAQEYVRRRKGSAVFFGRFTAALRVLVPGLAGMSGVHYPSFLAYNVAGGALWGTGFVLIGYLAGASYRRVERIASRVGLLLLALGVVALILSRSLRRYRERFPTVNAIGERLAASRPIVWLRGRFPRQLAWMRARLDISSPRGFLLTFSVAVGALAAWAFGGITQDVVGHDEVALFDPNVETWVLAHRTGWLTSLMKTVTWLGSIAVIIPAALIIGLFFVSRRRDWRPLLLLGAAVAGAIGLYDIVKSAVARPRPPPSVWVGHYSGTSFPSAHATQAVAFYAMVAIVLGLRVSPRTGTALWSAAAAVALIVGASRVYLGAHWLTDVLGGYALGAVWVAVVAVLMLVAAPSGTGGGTRTESGEKLQTELD
jgi:undecaprenyl-diphosphatase